MTCVRFGGDGERAGTWGSFSWRDLKTKEEIFTHIIISGTNNTSYVNSNRVIDWGGVSLK